MTDDIDKKPRTKRRLCAILVKSKYMRSEFTIQFCGMLDDETFAKRARGLAGHWGKNNVFPMRIDRETYREMVKSFSI